jgi:catechol 2,3-dioxygenase-like lactoylglutathione lyase family enzyme
MAEMLMNRLLLIGALTLLVLSPASKASAQPSADGEVPAFYGISLNVTSVDEHKKFWVGALAGVAGPAGGQAIVRFQNTTVFLQVRKPSGGTKGSTFDHVGFSVTNLRQVVDRIKSGGFRMVTASEAPSNIAVKDDIGVVETGPVSGIAYALGPDDVKVELVELKAQSAPIASHHIHFFGPQREMHAWFMQTLGAKEAPSANPAAFVSASLPGIGMNFSPSQSPLAATAGRAIDHVVFEVKNLEVFLKALESRGVKATVPYARAPALGLATAFISDPWGTSIEIVERLN